MMRIPMLFLLTVFITCAAANANPVIVSLNKIYRSYSDFSIKFNGDTFVFGRPFDKNDTDSQQDVEGLTFSFVDFTDNNTQRIKMVTRGRGLNVLDVTTSSKEDGLVKTYEIDNFGDKIRITQKMGGMYYAVNIYLNSEKETRYFGIDCLSGNLSPDGVPYFFEPEHMGYFTYPSSGWLPNRPQYTRLYPKMYAWTSKVADINYDAIMADDNIERHFDILFGQGLAEYIIQRNAEEDVTDESVLAYRQAQSLVLLFIMGSYKQSIVDKYSNAFSISEAFSYIHKTINMPRYTEVWLKRSADIERKVEETKSRVTVKK